MVNVKYTNRNNSSDYYYELDLSVNCTADDALDKNAYDGDETTYVDTSSGKTYFYLGENLPIYYMGFKLSSDPSYMIWKPENIGSQVNTPDCSTVNGYYYNNWVSSTETAYGGKKAWILQRVYEIKYSNPRT